MAIVGWDSDQFDPILIMATSRIHRSKNMEMLQEAKLFDCHVLDYIELMEAPKFKISLGNGFKRAFKGIAKISWYKMCQISDFTGIFELQDFATNIEKFRIALSAVAWKCGKQYKQLYEEEQGLLFDQQVLTNQLHSKLDVCINILFIFDFICHFFIDFVDNYCKFCNVSLHKICIFILHLLLYVFFICLSQSSLTVYNDYIKYFKEEAHKAVKSGAIGPDNGRWFMLSLMMPRKVFEDMFYKHNHTFIGSKYIKFDNIGEAASGIYVSEQFSCDVFSEEIFDGTYEFIGYDGNKYRLKEPSFAKYDKSKLTGKIGCKTLKYDGKEWVDA